MKLITLKSVHVICCFMSICVVSQGWAMEEEKEVGKKSPTIVQNGINSTEDFVTITSEEAAVLPSQNSWWWKNTVGLIMPQKEPLKKAAAPKVISQIVATKLPKEISEENSEKNQVSAVSAILAVVEQIPNESDKVSVVSNVNEEANEGESDGESDDGNDTDNEKDENIINNNSKIDPNHIQATLDDQIIEENNKTKKIEDGDKKQIIALNTTDDITIDIPTLYPSSEGGMNILSYLPGYWTSNPAGEGVNFSTGAVVAMGITMVVILPHLLKKS